MYEYIRGTLRHIYPTYLVIETHGLAYKILTPNPFSWQEEGDREVLCYLELIVREDAQTLYGFRQMEEKVLFQTLNKVSGIGPKSALSILAAGDHQGLVTAIDQGDITYLTKFPGVGKKTAQQMILDLGGKLTSINPTTLAVTPVQDRSLIEETQEALLGLGYSPKEVSKVLGLMKDQAFTTTQQALSFAFKQLIHL